jgi:hypothetical protein
MEGSWWRPQRPPPVARRPSTSNLQALNSNCSRSSPRSPPPTASLPLQGFAPWFRELMVSSCDCAFPCCTDYNTCGLNSSWGYLPRWELSAVSSLPLFSGERPSKVGAHNRCALLLLFSGNQVRPFFSYSQEIKWGAKIFCLFDRIEGTCHLWSLAACKVPDSGIVAVIHQQRRLPGGDTVAASPSSRRWHLPGWDVGNAVATSPWSRWRRRGGSDFQLCGHLESVPNLVAISEIDVHSVLQNFNRIFWCSTCQECSFQVC